jgi:hypothetical protein
MLPILTSTTTLGNTFENLAFSMFGSAEFFGFAVIIAIMIIMGVSKAPPRFMFMVAGMLVIAFRYIYGGVIFNTMSIIIVVIFGYLISKMFFEAFSRR